ncbi:hypothetical protein PVAP13_1KG125577 [Panicum virgatum]|uniref:Tf2-1-like SH3-like domain-containing protein n=1 Tax=Panicum virgatum TaxID=38727 RepID=A0A8T0XG37_PANVG|nr:hypothetical protein PVAP13_1KG125577 [Panicum virgatum]
MWPLSTLPILPSTAGALSTPTPILSTPTIPAAARHSTPAVEAAAAAMVPSRFCPRLATSPTNLICRTIKILSKIGNVAYKLDLPDHSRIHPVVRVSQLKKQVQWSGLSSSLATWEDEDDFRRFPQSIALGSGRF